MIITKHGSKRIKERVGLPKRAHLRHIEKVFSCGEIFSEKTSEKLNVIYNGFLYIFSFIEKKEPILITTYKAQSNLYI